MVARSVAAQRRKGGGRTAFLEVAAAPISLLGPPESGANNRADSRPIEDRSMVWYEKKNKEIDSY